MPGPLVRLLRRSRFEGPLVIDENFIERDSFHSSFPVTNSNLLTGESASLFTHIDDGSRVIVTIADIKTKPPPFSMPDSPGAAVVSILQWARIGAVPQAPPPAFTSLGEAPPMSVSLYAQYLLHIHFPIHADVFAFAFFEYSGVPEVDKQRGVVEFAREYRVDLLVLQEINYYYFGDV